MTGVRVKGSVLKSRLAFVQDLAPDGGSERVLAHLSAPEQVDLRGLLATKWYPFELGRRLDEAIVAELGQGRAAFFEELGVASADKNLTGVHKEFLVAGNPHAFLERTPMIYSFYYDKGRREYQKTGPSEALLTTYDRGDLQRSRLRHGRGLASPGPRDVRGPQSQGRRGGVPRPGRRGVPLPAELVLSHQPPSAFISFSR